MPISYFLLGVAILATWAPPSVANGLAARWGWQALLALALAAALAEGQVTWVGAVPVTVLWAMAVWYESASSPSLRTACAWGAAVLAVALATHRLPGFSPLLIADTQLSPASVPMTLRAHLDKGMAGLILLAVFTRRSTTFSGIARSVAVGLGVGLATAAIVIGPVALSGAVRLDPKLPAIALQWMAVNLFLTCVLEEALFRGLLQDRLARKLAGRRWGAWIALAVASLLFGLVHAGGGPLLILAAAAAGAGYGTAYKLTGRMEAPLIAHFALNTVHFLGFTYPYVAS